MAGQTVRRDYGAITQQFFAAHGNDPTCTESYLRDIDRRWRRLGKLAAAGRLGDTPAGFGPPRLGGSR